MNPLKRTSKMPTKNRPKRFNRNISVRVARRKRKQRDRLSGNKRVRNARPKNKINNSILVVSKPQKKTSKKEVVEKTE